MYISLSLADRKEEIRDLKRQECIVEISKRNECILYRPSNNDGFVC